MDSIVFSIIIPAYNIAGYIEECVKSVCPLEPYEEVIIVDDGSTDETGAICDRLAGGDDRIRVIHKENGGPSSARNIGLKDAKGEYIIFADGDDWLNRNVLIKIKEKIQSKPDIVFCEITKVWEDGKRRPMGDGITQKIDSMKDAELLRYLSRVNKFPGSPCGKAFRKTFLIENDLFFKEGILSEDIDWFFRLYPMISSAKYCEDVLYFYRQGRAGSTTTTRGSRHAKDLLAIVEEYAGKLEELKAEKTADVEKTATIDLYRSLLEYELRVLLIKRNDVDGEERGDFRKRLKKLKYLTGFRKDIKSRLIAVLYRILI